MAITVSCACGQTFRVKDDLAGKKIKCPKCAQPLAIPAAEGAVDGGSMSLDDLMKLDAGASALPGFGAPLDPAAAPGGQAQAPAAGGAGGFQPAGFPFGQAAAQSKSSQGSNKKMLLALCGLGGFALLAIGGVIFMLMSGGDKTTESVATNNPGAANSAPPSNTTPTSTDVSKSTPGSGAKVPALATLVPVSVEPGGRATVELRVERNGHEGAIQVQIAGAPAGVTATAVEIPAGKSAGQLQIAAPESIPGMELTGKVEITIKIGQAQATQSLPVTITKANIPAFAPVAGIIVQPGATATVTLTLQRNGYVGPIEVRPEGISEKLSLKASDIAAGQDASKLEVTAALDTPEATHALKITATAQGRTINLAIPLQIDKAPFRVKSLTIVTLKPGETKTVQVALERRSYKGPIRLVAENLPEGVTHPAVEVAPDQAAATLTLTAAKELKERIRTAKVVASAAHLTASDAMLIRVTRGDMGFLPVEVTANKELFGLLKRGSFGGRLTSASKQALLEAYGGSDESERAVLQGLRWLKDHQQQDGRWSLSKYHQGAAGCDCHTPFEEKVQDNDTAGTAFGLLPFLGAGITHNRAPEQPAELAKYQRVVKDGLAFLTKNQVEKGKDVGNLGGGMYSHAIATMALCEAYGLSGDDKLRIPAKRAVQYLIDAQHTGGGWRYGPNQPGDMSVTGWVFLAIRDGQLSGTPVPSETIKKAEKFLDFVSVGPSDAPKSQYCYDPAADATPSPTRTAAGLLSRQYSGWKQETPDLLAGCKHLMLHLPASQPAPNEFALGSMYYYYYATQVLHHMEGEQFDLWNYHMREHLLRTQQKSGHRAGSWEAQGCDHGATGGRLYSTSLALLTLEVYYRHLPLYRTFPAALKAKE